MRIALEILGALVLAWGLYEVVKLAFRGARSGHRIIDEESTRTFGGRDDEEEECMHSHPRPEALERSQQRDRTQRGPRRAKSNQPPTE